jgi:hypothetical protein
VLLPSDGAGDRLVTGCIVVAWQLASHRCPYVSPSACTIICTARYVSLSEEHVRVCGRRVELDQSLHRVHARIIAGRQDSRRQRVECKQSNE